MEEDAAGTALEGRARRIREAADRCSKIVATFLAMARQRRPERTAVNVNKVLDGALDLAAYGLRSTGIVIERRFAPDLPLVEADADQLTRCSLISSSTRSMRFKSIMASAG
jgi:nitrogen-specific signal transduction histidine kinase